MSIETEQLINKENAEFTAQIANVTDNATKADMEEKHRARLAAIMGSACVSGGIIIVATGIAAKQALESEPPRDCSPLDGRRLKHRSRRSP